MKKWIVFAGIVALITLALFLPKTTTYTEEIAHPHYRVIEFFTNNKMLQKWMHPFAAQDTLSGQLSFLGDSSITWQKDQVVINKVGYNDALLILKMNNHSVIVKMMLATSPKDVDVTKVSFSYSTNWFKEITSPISASLKKSLQNLKKYMEDTEQYYGYKIEKEQVVDTDFFFAKVSVKKADQQLATKNVFKLLTDFAQSKNVKLTGTRIMHIQDQGEDSVNIFASVGIASRYETSENSIVQYKVMPAGKALLVASYQGPYKNVTKVYDALEKFKANNHLTSMAMPFHKILTPNWDYNPESMVQLKVCYPVY